VYFILLPEAKSKKQKAKRARWTDVIWMDV
jgi:hypothetical protein